MVVEKGLPHISPVALGLNSSFSAINEGVLEQNGFQSNHSFIFEKFEITFKNILNFFKMQS